MQVVRVLNMNKVIYSMLICVFCGLSVAGTYDDDFKALSKVDASDGINEEEAHVIAEAFFLSKISGCGYPEKPVREGGFWVSKTRIGYAGQLGDSIFIEVGTGTITWGNKNNPTTLDELRKLKSKTSLQATQ